MGKTIAIVIQDNTSTAKAVRYIRRSAIYTARQAVG
jgi:hypothetical protein